MVVTLKVSPDVARSLRQGGEGAPDPASLMGAVARYDAVLRPQHLRVTDPELARYFTAELTDDSRGASFVDELRHAPGVEAAYVKPPDAPP